MRHISIDDYNCDWLVKAAYPELFAAVWARLQGWRSDAALRGDAALATFR
jgi:hypothetical protein